LKLFKIITILVDIAAGAVVVTIGLTMLPFPYNIVWAGFNAYIWIALPSILLHVNRKEKA